MSRETTGWHRGDQSNMKLENQVALITGASRGIGRAIALTFAREGANIVINYVTNDKVAEEYSFIPSSIPNASLELSWH